MKSIHKEGLAFYIARYRLMLMLGGYELTPGSRVLDFGCGAGHMVYAFRDAGFDARGFDIHDYVHLCAESDRGFFDIAADASPDPANFVVDWNTYRLPYPDHSFDFVFSVSVMEHVQNHEAVLRELARVTRCCGVNIHEFPPRWSLIEPHINVPFGGAITHPMWYTLWALLGVRNEDQRQRKATAADAIALNLKYARTGIKYLPNRELHAIGNRYFSRSIFVPEVHDYCSAPHLGIRLKHALHVTRWYESAFRNVVWWLDQN